MFIPPKQFITKNKEVENASGPVRLKSSHLLIDHQVAAALFGDDHNVYVVYYPNKQSLIIAPVSDELFKKLHKASQHLLKDRNLNGDKSIALHELLIDHQLDASDRDLEFEMEPALGVLNIKIE